VGDKVLARIPGILGKLEEAWTGPYVILERCGPVTVERKDVSGRSKVLNLNTLKRWEQSVRRSVVVFG